MHPPEKKRYVILVPLALVSLAITYILNRWTSAPGTDVAYAIGGAMGGAMVVMIIPIVITSLIALMWKSLAETDIVHWRRRYRATFFLIWFFWAALCILGQIVQTNSH